MSDELLIENIKALLHLNASNSLVPHGIGNHARDLLDASITSIDRLRAEIASLKEQNSAVTLASAHLINQLAAANGRVEKLEKAMWDISQGNARVIQHADQCSHGRYGYEDCETCIADFADAALSDLPEADKEKA